MTTQRTPGKTPRQQAEIVGQGAVRTPDGR